MTPPDRLEAVEDAIRSADPPVVTAPEIASIVLEGTDVYDDVGDPRREAYGDLELLERTGVVESKETGSRARAWWHTDRVRPPPGEIEAGPDPIPDVERDDRELELEDAPDPDADPGLEDALSSWDPGRSREEYLERYEAGLAALEWLRDRDLDRPASRADVLAATYDDAAPENQSEDAFWRKTARPAFQHAADVDLVEIDAKKYQWIG